MYNILFVSNKSKISLISSLLLLSTFSVSFSQWKLVIDKDSVKVYNKPNVDGYSFYMAEGVINASMNEVYNTFTNIEEHPLWISNCAETRIIQKTIDKEIIYLSVYDFPWPTSDRYSISHMKITKKEDKYIQLKSGPAKNQSIIIDGMVHVTRFDEGVEIFYINNNKTKIKLTGAYDPAGAIPAWVTDKFMKYSPYESILEMKVLLDKKSGK